MARGAGLVVVAWIGRGLLRLISRLLDSQAIRPIALGRKNYLFMGSLGGGKAAAIAYTLIETAKMNGVDPKVWLTHVIDTIADPPASKINELMPWRHAELSE